MGSFVSAFAKKNNLECINFGIKRNITGSARRILKGRIKPYIQFVPSSQDRLTIRKNLPETCAELYY